MTHISTTLILTLRDMFEVSKLNERTFNHFPALIHWSGEMNFKVQVAYAPNTIESQCDADSQDFVVENIGDSASDKVSEKGLFGEMWFFRHCLQGSFPCVILFKGDLIWLTAIYELALFTFNVNLDSSSKL